MKNTSHLLLLVSVTACCFSLSAQNSPVTSGGVASGSGGTQSFSIGQVFYSQFSSASGSLNQGVQQPYAIEASIGINDPRVSLELSAFPNPTRDYLNLKVINDESLNLEYRMLGLNGQVLETGIASEGATIDVQNFAASTYFLQVIESERIIKTFRIIKN